MPMKPGASGSEEAFSDSLAEAIESAFKMEWQKAKGEPLPDDGADDRRLLFAAFAQGILNYLKDHDGDFKVLTAASGISTIYIQSPHLDVQPKGEGSSNLIATGRFFPPNKQISLIWNEPANQYNSLTGPSGFFEFEFLPPSDAAAGKHIVEARDDAGHVAFAVFLKS